MRKLVLMTALAAGFTVTAAAVSAQPYGPGMMYSPSYGYGMMGGYGPGYMMGPGYGPGYMMGPAYGPGWMMNGYRGYGPGMMAYGPGYPGDLHLSIDQVKNYLEWTIRNPNLKVGEVKEKNAGTIVADIVTNYKDALVQKLYINRHNGYMQPEQ